METGARIDDLIDRWEDLQRRGTPPTLEELCAECPELLPEVRRRIEALGVVDSALDTEETEVFSRAGDLGNAGADEPPARPQIVRATAVYQTRHPHDRGGLGVIFLAEQTELDRPVALKRIRPDRLHEAARRRFLREAAITARLQHPGIVPIYGLGEDDDGPFYTMPFIRGRTLQQVIEAFHGDESLRGDPGRWRLGLSGLLQPFLMVCNTVAYAHDQGIVHRDLKPSNIMLGPYGETLVMDWGLAKRLGGEEAEEEAGRPDRSAQDVTITGDIVGTPLYMSPEQARGNPPGPAGDVFSLGLILYTILTGTSAFDESSFRGDDPLKAVARVGDRAASPAGPGPAPRPGGDLSEGAGGPARGSISVRPRPGPGCHELAGRRAGRRLARAGLDPGAAMVAAPPHGCGGADRRAGGGRGRTGGRGRRAGPVQPPAPAGPRPDQQGPGRHREGAGRHPGGAVQARANLAEAHVAVEEIYTRVAEKLGQRGGMEDYERELLEKARRFYETVALPQARDHPIMRLAAGQAIGRLGHFWAKLAELDKAEAAYRRALEVLDSLVADFPGEARYRRRGLSRTTSWPLSTR